MNTFTVWEIWYKSNKEKRWEKLNIKHSQESRNSIRCNSFVEYCWFSLFIMFHFIYFNLNWIIKFLSPARYSIRFTLNSTSEKEQNDQIDHIISPNWDFLCWSPCKQVCWHCPMESPASQSVIKEIPRLRSTQWTVWHWTREMFYLVMFLLCSHQVSPAPLFLTTGNSNLDGALFGAGLGFLAGDLMLKISRRQVYLLQVASSTTSGTISITDIDQDLIIVAANSGLVFTADRLWGNDLMKTILCEKLFRSWNKDLNTSLSCSLVLRGPPWRVLSDCCCELWGWTFQMRWSWSVTIDHHF